MTYSVSNLPLHGGKAPHWLLKRMRPLAESIMNIMVLEYGPDEVVSRLADPYWFQALSCVLGFDWHSSGTTTVTTGVLTSVLGPELGVCMCGGKGSRSGKTPGQIVNLGEELSLSDNSLEYMVKASRLTAKIDNAAVQDSFNLYHHAFLMSEKGSWAVIQQGMNGERGMARRYQWLSKGLEQGYLDSPHSGILSEVRRGETLDLSSKRSGENRTTVMDLVSDLGSLRRDYETVLGILAHSQGQSVLEDFGERGASPGRARPAVLDMPRRINWNTMRKVYDFSPRNYEELILTRGMGPRTVRALALIADLVYGAEPSWRDPMKYTFTVGGKDGVPYPVDKPAMDDSIDVLENAVGEAKVGKRDKLRALERLRSVIPEELRESKARF